MTNLQSKAVSAIDRIGAVLKTVNFEDKIEYGCWLAQTYYFVRHATRVLTKAAARCSFAQEDLHKSLLNSVNEEKNHELLALMDLETLGLKVELFPEFAETSAYYMGLYHLIDELGPEALPGYFIAIEGLAAVGGKDLMARLRASTNRDALKFLKMHVEVDSGHFDEGLSWLGAADFSIVPTIERSLNLSSNLYIAMLKRIRDERSGLYEVLRSGRLAGVGSEKTVDV